MAVVFAPSLVGALRRPALRPFWLAQFLVYFAQQAWQTVLLWALLDLTHSATWVAVGLGVLSLPPILVGIAGPGRFTLARHLPALPLAAGASLLALALACARIAGVPALVALLLLAGLVEGLFAALQLPLLQADLARTVHATSLAAANSAMELASGLGALAGPLAAGALLVGPGLAVTLALCGGAMLVAGPAVRSWQRRALAAGARPATAPPGPARASAHGLYDALAYIRRDAFLRVALGTRTANNVLWPVLTVALPILVATRWHAGALGYGLLLAARGVGSIGGTALGARLDPSRLGRAFFAAWLVEAAAFVGLALSPLWAPALAFMAMAGVASPLVHVALDSRIGRAVDEHARSAVFGMQRLAMSGAGLLGTLGAGAVLALTAAGPVLAAAGLAVGACALAGYGVADRAGGFGDAGAVAAPEAAAADRAVLQGPDR